MSWRTPAITALGMVASVVLVAGCGGTAAESSSRSGPDSATSSAAGPGDSSAAVSATSTLKCSDHIGTGPPADDLKAVADAVALPVAASSGRLQAGRTGDTRRTRWFAKRGLVVKTGESFDLIVPPEERHRLAIGWGNPAQPTWRLHASCPEGNATWRAFAGGYFVRKRGCVSLIVRADGHQERVRIGVGARCRSGAESSRASIVQTR